MGGVEGGELPTLNVDINSINPKVAAGVSVCQRVIANPYALFNYATGKRWAWGEWEGYVNRSANASDACTVHGEKCK